MITRLLATRLPLFFFSTKTLAGKSVADIPSIEYPTKPKPKEE